MDRRARRTTAWARRGWALAAPLLLLAGGLALLSAVPDLQRLGPLAVLASFAPVGVLAGAVAALLLTTVLLTTVLRATVLRATVLRTGPQRTRTTGRRPSLRTPRSWPRPLAGLVVAVICILVPLVPSLAELPARDDLGEGELTVVALNMQEGQADVEQLAAAAAGADVLVLSELTPAARERVVASGLAEELPHRGGAGADGFAGTVVLSRYPMETEAVLELSFQQRLVRIQVPGIGAVRVLAVHPVSPLGGPSRWEDEHQRLIELAGTVDDAPLVVAGDFNAVDQHLVMHRWRAAGLVDAAHTSGVGWLRTWPAESPALPLLGIDHVLSSADLRARELTTFAAAGSDHLGVRAVLTSVDRD